MLALAPLKGADPLGGQAGALRQLLLTQSSGFTVPAEFSAEVAAALACAHRWVIVPTAHRVWASKCGGSVGVASVGRPAPLGEAVRHPHSEMN